ncbi:MAG: hypothetical protein ACI965_001973 [Paraglaciecola sp.]|jgi:hypothetical protein
MSLFLLLSIFISAALNSPAAYADLDCQVALNYGLVVNKQQIRVLDESRTLYQINDNKQLIVQGEWLRLNSRQAADLQELSTGIHKVVPKMVLLANEGVELAIDTVEHVYLGLVGKDHKSQEKLQSSLKRVKMRVKEKFIHASDHFYMGSGSVENVDDRVDKELEEQIEQAMATSLGGILSAIGSLVASEQTTDEKIDEIAQQLETMGEEIVQSVPPKAHSMQQKAGWFCNKFKELDRVEERLRQSIPALKPYNVFATGEQVRSD